SIAGPAGAIEVALDAPEHGPARGFALIAHPHPLFGGTMDNKVVTTLARAANSVGLAAVRFNFRGVGASAGVFDEGVGETADFLAVYAWASEQMPGGARKLAGFSFGAFVAAQAAQQLQASAHHHLFLAGVATSRFAVPVVDPSTIVVHGELDDVVPLASVMDWARPQELPIVVIPGASHFFDRKLSLIKRLAVDAFAAERNN
ncbi:MAG: alpha/beta hydrolase, partial [Burkholderiaceae bacterium]